MPNLRLNGWMTEGAKPLDTRTAKQLIENIDYFAEKLPEVAKFKKELKSMNPKHLNLVSDICELTGHDLNGKNIDIRKLQTNGKSLFAALIEILPKASKENPESLNFAQEVINHTGNTASKYFLATCAGFFEHPEAAKHLAATRPMIKDIAQAALNGGMLLDYSKEQKFVNAINQFVNPSVNPENIKMLTKVCKAAENAPVKNTCIDAIDFIHSKTPISTMQENLETFNQISKELSKQTDNINLTDFVTNNINLY